LRPGAPYHQHPNRCRRRPSPARFSPARASRSRPPLRKECARERRHRRVRLSCSGRFPLRVRLNGRRPHPRIRHRQLRASGLWPDSRRRGRWFHRVQILPPNSASRARRCRAWQRPRPRVRECRRRQALRYRGNRSIAARFVQDSRS
jgi:hypothetical protein